MDKQFNLKTVIFASGLIVLIIFGIIVIKKNHVNEEGIKFDNPQFEEALERNLGVDSIAVEQAKKIKTISIQDANIQNCNKDIKHFINLEELELVNCGITSLDCLKGLDKLRIVNLEGNKINDISEICHLQLRSLETIIFDKNPIENINIEWGLLPNLKSMCFQDCYINGDVDLGELSEVEYICLNKNSIISIKGKFPNLIQLKLHDNNIKSFADIIKIPSLKEIVVSDNYLKNVNGVNKFKSLEVIDIRENNIDNVHLLSEMETINTIYMDKDINREQIDFLYDNFKDGDRYTKQYILRKRYNLK